MKLLLSIILLFAIGITQSFACSCRPLEKITLEDYKNAGAIFIGKALKVDVDKDNHMKTITFEVQEALKGVATSTNKQKVVKKKRKRCFLRKIKDNTQTTVENTKTIVIETPLSGAACGLSIQEGDTWYLWASQYPDSPLSTGLCSRSILLEGDNFEDRSKRDPKRYQEERAFIEKISNK